MRLSKIDDLDLSMIRRRMEEKIRPVRSAKREYDGLPSQRERHLFPCIGLRVSQYHQKARLDQAITDV